MENDEMVIEKSCKNYMQDVWERVVDFSMDEALSLHDSDFLFLFSFFFVIGQFHFWPFCGLGVHKPSKLHDLKQYGNNSKYVYDKTSRRKPFIMNTSRAFC